MSSRSGGNWPGTKIRGERLAHKRSISARKDLTNLCGDSFKNEQGRPAP